MKTSRCLLLGVAFGFAAVLCSHGLLAAENEPADLPAAEPADLPAAEPADLPEAEPADLPAAEPPPPPTPMPGRYFVAVGGEHAILLDGVTGQTWWLISSHETGEPQAWLPLERVDGDEQGALWREKTRLKEYQKRYQPDHVKIQELQNKIESLESELRQARAELSDNPAIAQALLPLILEEQQLIETRGPNHPEVRSIQKKIETVREFLLKKQQSSAANSPSSTNAP